MPYRARHWAQPITSQDASAASASVTVVYRQIYGARQDNVQVIGSRSDNVQIKGARNDNIQVLTG